jgi:uncharacterized protein (TIGR02611 family)
VKKWLLSLKSWLKGMPRLRKAIIGIIGGTVIVFGIVLIVLPGPSSIVIPLGLGILATEFAWARHVLRRGKRVIDKARRGKWREAVSVATNHDVS